MKGRDLIDRIDRRRLFQVAMAILRHRQEAEDAVQDALLGLLDRDLDPDPAKVNAYASHCVRHRAIERWRRTQEGIQKLMVALPSEDVLSKSDVVTELENRCMAERIAVALAREPAEDRLCILVPPHEAAERLGIPVGTAKSRGFRVRCRVRAQIAGQDA